MHLDGILDSYFDHPRQLIFLNMYIFHKMLKTGSQHFYFLIFPWCLEPTSSFLPDLYVECSTSLWKAVTSLGYQTVESVTSVYISFHSASHLPVTPHLQDSILSSDWLSKKTCRHERGYIMVVLLWLAYFTEYSDLQFNHSSTMAKVLSLYDVNMPLCRCAFSSFTHWFCLDQCEQCCIELASTPILIKWFIWFIL